MAQYSRFSGNGTQRFELLRAALYHPRGTSSSFQRPQKINLTVDTVRA
jgi:hypothetical protein